MLPKKIFIYFILFSCLFSSGNAFVSTNESQKRIIEERGGKKVKAVKYSDDSWGLLVGGKPYFIKGVVFSPVKIGEDPASATMRDWMYYDDNGNGVNDLGFETRINEGRVNNDKNLTGDFGLLKEMGCNTIRLYHVPSDNAILGGIYKNNDSTALQFDHKINKELLRRLYKDYGIRVIVGNFLGAWTIGSGASWEEGTDYNNPVHIENIKKSVKAMVLDNKDEPYVLFWLLGNENNIADWSRCNAKSNPAAYAKLIGELAQMIHLLDPNHPVAVCDGDNFNTLNEYAKYAQDIDIVAFNSYRGEYGFGNIWKTCKRVFDRPVFISEFGTSAYNINKGEDEDYQLKYISGCWKDIVLNSSNYISPEKKLFGNSIGGVVFDWVDRWYMDGNPLEHNPGNRPGHSPDNLRHEEWFGIMSMGDGKDLLLRYPRKVYYYLKDVWSKKSLEF